MGKSGRSGQHKRIEGEELREQRLRMVRLARPLGYHLHPDATPAYGSMAAVARHLGANPAQGSHWWSGQRKMPDEAASAEESKNL